MGDFDNGAAEHARGAEPAEDDSPAPLSFLTRLFRRDAWDSESTHEPRACREAADISGDLRRMRVDEVSVPRGEIIAVPDTASLDEVVAVFQTSEMTRLPVYSGVLDQPRGLVHLKDLALRWGFGAPSAAAFDLGSVLRPLLYAPPSMPIGALLQKMQAARIHMALVIDEFGGVDGLVTIEDLIEPIVGEIEDEHDVDDSALFIREGPNSYIAQARADLEDFEDEAGVRLAPPELAHQVDTLGGLLFRLAGRVPARGEVVSHPEGHQFEVLDADARKIKRLRVRLRGGAEPARAAE